MSKSKYRPCLAFVVEGRGEYESYPSIVSKVFDSPSGRIPIAEASGWGDVWQNLEMHLTDVIATCHPHMIIVTVDLADVIEGTEHDACDTVRAELQRRCDEWRARQSADSAPDEVVVVLQCQMLESWILADLDCLSGCYGLADSHEELPKSVDEQPSPVAWLKRNCASPPRTKRPKEIKSLLSSINIATARQSSRSFDKFCREIERAWTIAYPAAD